MAVASPSRIHSVIRVRPLRQWFGLSLDAFARALGVGRATVARWEAANSGPHPDSAEGRLLAAFAEIRRLATSLFGAQGARQWFNTPVPALRGTPRAALVKRGPLPVQHVLWEDQHNAY